MTAFSLASDDATLHIAPDTGDWSRVTLELATGREALGADAHAKIVARLTAGLAPTLSGSTIGMIKGNPVRVVMSLFDEHCTIYAADEGNIRQRFVQRADTTLATTLRLSRECCEKWLAVLAK